MRSKSRQPKEKTRPRKIGGAFRFAPCALRLSLRLEPEIDQAVQDKLVHPSFSMSATPQTTRTVLEQAALPDSMEGGFAT